MNEERAVFSGDCFWAVQDPLLKRALEPGGLYGKDACDRSACVRFTQRNQSLKQLGPSSNQILLEGKRALILAATVGLPIR
jgi:hypothetical protein